MKNKNKINSVQEWLEIDEILINGIIKLNNENYVKIIKVNPVNYLMKTDFEKTSILEAYKIFLKTCNFDIQIIIQNKKEDLSNNIKIIKNKIEEEKNEKINEIRKKYIEYIQNKNLKTKSSSRNFFIIIKNNNLEQKDEEIIIEELNDKFLKIEECLKRCGNIVEEISDIENKNIIYSFFNTRKFLSLNKEVI